VANRFRCYIQSAIREFVTTDQTQVLTNKTIDADDNTISDLQTANLKAGVLNIDLSVPTPTDAQIPSALAAQTYSDNVASGVQTNLTNHINDLVDAHDSSAISADTTGYNYSIANEVQAVLDDFDAAIFSAAGDAGTVQTNLNNHINDISDAHDASAISYDNTTSLLVATNAQSAIDEVDTNLDNHISALSVHGSLQGTIPLLASQVNTNLLDLSAYSAARIMFYVVVDSTFETFDILTVKRGADYKLTTLSVGDSTGISFEITAGGMITYSSGALTSGSLKYLVNTII
jgi:hypothetical protein